MDVSVAFLGLDDSLSYTFGICEFSEWLFNHSYDGRLGVTSALLHKRLTLGCLPSISHSYCCLLSPPVPSIGAT